MSTPVFCGKCPNTGDLKNNERLNLIVTVSTGKKIVNLLIAIDNLSVSFFNLLTFEYFNLTAKYRLGYIFPEIFFGGIGYSWSSTVHLVEIFYYPETITSKTLNSCQNLIASNLQNLVSENFRPGVKLMTNCIRFRQRKSMKKIYLIQNLPVKLKKN